ncbi:hypothetical protein [Limosilactobacillus oris]|nr:hypothetical protein [Limosilactobacillus oris]
MAEELHGKGNAVITLPPILGLMTMAERYHMGSLTAIYMVER